MITSLSNQTIKAIRGLREKKGRNATGLFLIEGLRIVAEALEQRGRVETLVFAPGLLTSDFGLTLVSEQSKRGIDILEVSDEVFKSISGKDGPQGLAAVVRQNWETLNSIHLMARDIWVALDSIADPGNLGTILRTLDAVGGSGVILLDHSTDPYDPTALRASMGAVFSNHFVRSSFSEFSEWVNVNDYKVIGTSDKAVLDYRSVMYPDPIILLMGSERQGLSQPAMDLCETMVSIPMVGRGDSLNLAVATGIVLYEIFHQKQNR